MEDEKLTEISMKGAPPCGRCHMLVARYAPQVVATTGTYHRECYEAWYFGRYGRRPACLPGSTATGTGTRSAKPKPLSPRGGGRPGPPPPQNSRSSPSSGGHTLR